MLSNRLSSSLSHSLSLSLWKQHTEWLDAVLMNKLVLCAQHESCTFKIFSSLLPCISGIRWGPRRFYNSSIRKHGSYLCSLWTCWRSSFSVATKMINQSIFIEFTKPIFIEFTKPVCLSLYLPRLWVLLNESVSHLNCALFNRTCPVPFTNSLRLFCPGLGAPRVFTLKWY